MFGCLVATSSVMIVTVLIIPKVRPVRPTMNGAKFLNVVKRSDFSVYFSLMYIKVGNTYDSKVSDVDPNKPKIVTIDGKKMARTKADPTIIVIRMAFRRNEIFLSGSMSLFRIVTNMFRACLHGNEDIGNEKMIAAVMIIRIKLMKT
jgi:hypothetical protein